MFSRGLRSLCPVPLNTNKYKYIQHCRNLHNIISPSKSSSLTKIATFDELPSIIESLSNSSSFPSSSPSPLSKIYNPNNSDNAEYFKRLEKACQEGAINMKILENGIRVVVDPFPGNFVAAGIYINVGSSNEEKHEIGVSSLIEKCAFKVTKKCNEDKMQERILQLGSAIQCQSSKDGIFYHGNVMPNQVQPLFELLHEDIFESIAHEDSASLKNIELSELYEFEQIKDNPEMLLSELSHIMAFGGKGFGNSLLSRSFPNETNGMEIGGEKWANELPLFTQQTINEFKAKWFRPEHIIIAASGVSLDNLVAIVEPLFGQIPTSSLISNPLPFVFNADAYKGGSIFITDDRFQQNIGLLSNNRYAENNHFLITVPSCPSWHPDLFPSALMSSLLGGGSSFSAGGPGKGLYTRFYRKVLNQYHFAEAIQSLQFSYDSLGLTGVFASFPEKSARKMLQIIIKEWISMSQGLEKVEFERAKNQLKSNLLIALENKSAQLEDLMKSVALLKSPISKQFLLDEVDSIKEEDCKRIRNRLFGWESNEFVLPTYVAAGLNVSSMPKMEELIDELVKQKKSFYN